MKRLGFSLALIFVTLATSACATTTPLPPPRVTINTPSNSAIIDAGQPLPVQAVAEDAQGIARVELLVDGQTIKTDASPNGAAQKSFAVLQTWQASGGGLHVIVVRATSTQGAVAEAAVSVTVVEKTAPPTPTPLGATPIPTRAAVVATSAPAKTITPTTNPRRTLTLTEAQVNALIAQTLAASNYDFITASSVSLQNGQITVRGTGKAPTGATTTGTVVVAVTASNCDFKVTVTQAQVGAFALSDARKAQLNLVISQALASAVAQQSTYKCIEAVSIANGVMTVVYR